MAFYLAIIIVEGFIQANKKHLSLGASCTSTLRRVDSVSLPAVTLLLFFYSMSTKKLDPQLDIAMDWNFNIIINEYMTCLCLCHLT